MRKCLDKREENITGKNFQIDIGEIMSRNKKEKVGVKILHGVINALIAAVLAIFVFVVINY